MRNLFLPQITETKLQELKSRHPPVGCSFRLGMYFETLHEAKTFDHHEEPDHYSSVCGTECDDTGIGSLMLYDSVKGDSASAVNLVEVENVLLRKNTTRESSLAAISEEHHHSLDKVKESSKGSPKNFSIDSRSNGSGNNKEQVETSKSCTSLTSQDSGRESNGSSSQKTSKYSSEGTVKRIPEKEIHSTHHKAGKRSRSREKPTSRPHEETKTKPPQRVVVGAEESTLVELHDHKQAIRIIGKKSSMGQISERLYQRYPHVSRSETPMVPAAYHNSSIPVRSTKSNERFPSHERVLLYTPATNRPPKRTHPSTNTPTHLGYF